MSSINKVTYRNQANEIIGYGIIFPVTRESEFQYHLSNLSNECDYGRNPKFSEHSNYEGITIEESDLELINSGVAIPTDLLESTFKYYSGISFFLTSKEYSGEYTLLRIPYGTTYIQSEKIDLQLQDEDQELISCKSNSYIFISATKSNIQISSDIPSTRSTLIVKDLDEILESSYIAEFQKFLQDYSPLKVTQYSIKGLVSKLLRTESIASEKFNGLYSWKYLDIEVYRGVTYQCIVDQTNDSNFELSKDWIQL